MIVNTVFYFQINGNFCHALAVMTFFIFILHCIVGCMVTYLLPGDITYNVLANFCKKKKKRNDTKEIKLSLLLDLIQSYTDLPSNIYLCIMFIYIYIYACLLLSNTGARGGKSGSTVNNRTNPGG